MTELSTARPDRMISVREVFGIDTDLRVPAFAERDEHVPEIDSRLPLQPRRHAGAARRLLRATGA